MKRGLSEVDFWNHFRISETKLSSTVSLISGFFLTEVRVSSLAVVGGGAALCLVARGGGRCTRGGRGSGVFAGSVGDAAGPDSSETQTAARPRLTALRLRDAHRKKKQMYTCSVTGALIRLFTGSLRAEL